MWERFEGGGVAPYQAEGQLEDGRRFYLRARHTTIRLDVEGGHSVGFSLEYPQGDPHVWSYPDPKDMANVFRFLVHTLKAIEYQESKGAKIDWSDRYLIPGPGTP